MLEAAETGADSGGRFERITAPQRDIKTTERRLNGTRRRAWPTDLLPCCPDALMAARSFDVRI
jgi:hypothetical protein